MEKELTIEAVKKNGDYLGYCDQKKAYVYSVFTGYNSRGNKKYVIVTLNNGTVRELIRFNARPAIAEESITN